ncbi:hypothetical protein NMG60_11000501 [Bertholletia excelsa]
MWPVLLAAAVAGSGIFAKRLLSSNADLSTISEETGKICDEFEGQQRHCATPSQSQAPIPLTFLPCEGYGNSELDDQGSAAAGVGDGRVFRFSSSGSWEGTGFRLRSNVPRKKSGKDGFRKVERKHGFWDQSNKSGRKIGFCVKKRRTSKNAPGKCESCISKGNSFFSWGLGVGIICMMSAGKTEISRLNLAMDETAKAVQELKTELYRRKSSLTMQISSPKTKINSNTRRVGGKNTENMPQSGTENRDMVLDSGFLETEECEYATSILTEEPQPEVLEIDRLEAELESELQKLSSCSIEASALEGRIYDTSENDASAEGFYKTDGQNPNFHLSNGVMPSELDQKLCHLLIEQQENQIVQLESDLNHAQSKLQEKEAELQALKDCVRRLSQFSLVTASDEETESQMEEEKTHEVDHGDKKEPDSKRSAVGMKRAMAFESYSCHPV